MTTHQPHAGWRTLSDAEFANHPHAKLGGALAVIFWGAVAMVAMVLIVIAALIAFGDFFSVTMMSRMLFSGSSTTSIISGLAMIPQAVFFVWACTFVIMTAGRRPSTPTAASVMIAIWAFTSVSMQIAIRYVVAHNYFDVMSQASLFPYIVIDIVLVAAFCGYLSGGQRPNVYFRKRVCA